MSDRSNAQIIAEALLGIAPTYSRPLDPAFPRQRDAIQDAARVVAALEAEGRLTPAVQGDAKLLQNSDEREALRGIVLNVLCNASNFPERVQARILGQDMGPLAEKVVDAVLALTPDNWEYATARYEGDDEPFPAYQGSQADAVERLATVLAHDPEDSMSPDPESTEQEQ